MAAINTIKMSESDPEDERRRALLRQQAFADLLSQNVQRAGGDKVYGNGLGLAKIGGAALAGVWGRQADEQEKSEQAAADELIAGAVAKAYSGEGAAPSPAAAVDEAGDGGRARGMAYERATKGLESGGNYAALGPVTKSGDRAYGAYQIMGANIPSWSKEALGRSIGTQEFMSSREAQDKIYRAKMGQYVKKYGEEGAARAWHAGEGGMNNPNARDQLGTMTSEYGRRFMRGLGQDPGAGAPANPTSTPSAPSAAPAAGISAQDVQELVRNPRTRSYGLALYNAHVQDLATRQAQAAELAKEQRAQAFEREKIGLTKEPKLTTLKAGETAIDSSGRLIAQGTDQPGGDPKELAEVRKEILSLPSYKTYAAAIPAYRSMIDAAKRDTKSSDVNLVYGVAKIFDPTSVVREGEIVMAQDTGGVADRLNGMLRGLTGNARLSPQQRAGLIQEAQSRVQEHKSAFDTDSQFYSGIAERRKLNRADVVPQFPDMPAFDPSTINTVQPGPAGPAAPSTAGPANVPPGMPSPGAAPPTKKWTHTADGPGGVVWVSDDGVTWFDGKTLQPVGGQQAAPPREALPPTPPPRPMGSSSLPYSAYPVAGTRG